MTSPDVLLALALLAGAGVLLVTYLSFSSPSRHDEPDETPRSITRRQRLAFFAGCAVLVVALSPPLENWASLLISVHMLQDVLLMFVVPPLLLYGTPGWLLEPLLRIPGVARAGYVLTRPISILVLVSAVTIVWHLPQFYDAALRTAPVDMVQHLLVLTTSFLIWWPLLGSVAAWPRPSPFVLCLIYFVLTFPGAVVGSMLALGKEGVYPSSTLTPRPWGIALQMDQQFSGLTLWVGGAAIYLLLVSIVFFRWANREDANERGASASG